MQYITRLVVNNFFLKQLKMFEKQKLYSMFCIKFKKI